jgi:proteasome accessory factor B
MFAYDVSRKAMRTFALSRLSEPQLAPEKFTRPKRFSPDKYLEGSFGVLKGDEDYEIVIEFDAKGTDLIRARKWHPSQQLTELPDGCSQLRMRLSGLDEIERSVLNWGAHATVLRPQALAQRVRKTAQELVRRYS